MTRLSPDQRAYASMWRQQGRAWGSIAKKLGVTEYAVRVAIDPTFRERKAEEQEQERQSRRRHGKRADSARQNGGYSGSPFRPTEAEFRAAQKLIPPDTRDLTGVICGDPIPGRSALDRMRGGVPA